jgi:hypothetical protein
MFLLIVANGTLFVHLITGEIMSEEKASLGSGLLAKDAVSCNHTFSSSKIYLPPEENFVNKIRNGNRITYAG